MPRTRPPLRARFPRADVAFWRNRDTLPHLRPVDARRERHLSSSWEGSLIAIAPWIISDELVREVATLQRLSVSRRSPGALQGQACALTLAESYALHAPLDQGDLPGQLTRNVPCADATGRGLRTLWRRWFIAGAGVEPATRAGSRGCPSGAVLPVATRAS